MTNDYTPIEISLCWKNPKQEGNPIVRFIHDIIPEDAEKSRLASLTRAMQAIETLRKLSVAKEKYFYLQVLPDLWLNITETLADEGLRIHPSHNCNRCGPSSMFLGFDLEGFKISSKFYWLLPSCLDPREVLDVLDIIFSKCGLVSEYFASPAFLEAWLSIRDHLSHNYGSLQMRAHALS